MALTSTTHRVIPQGADQLITEHHVDGTGKVHVWTYSAPLAADIVSLLSEHKAQLESLLAEAEAEEIING